MIKTCGFCGGNLSGKRALEHVFPVWLQRLLGVSHVAAPCNVDIPNQLGHIEDASSLKWERVLTRKPVFDKLKAGQVCASCNNEWMSQLETMSSPVLIPLIEGTASPFNLNQEQKFLIARWALKTSIALNLASATKGELGVLSIPKEHALILKNDPQSLPIGISVFAGMHKNTKPLGWLQTRTWQGDSGISFDPSATYKIALQTGRLLLIVAYLPPQPLRLIASYPMHTPIWTWGEFGMRNARPLPLDTDSENSLYAFALYLGVGRPKQKQ